jgi:hypothetical protein
MLRYIVCVTEMYFAGELGEYPLREGRVFEANLATVGRQRTVPLGDPAYSYWCVQILGLLYGVTSLWLGTNFTWVFEFGY